MSITFSWSSPSVVESNQKFSCWIHFGALFCLENEEEGLGAGVGRSDREANWGGTVQPWAGLFRLWGTELEDVVEMMEFNTLTI